MIKRVLAGSQETDIGQYFSSPKLREDVRNHCVPFLDVFHDDEDDGYNYIIEPVLRDFKDPGFFAVGEVVEFVRQMLEVRDHTLSPPIAYCSEPCGRDCSSCTMKVLHTSWYIYIRIWFSLN